MNKTWKSVELRLAKMFGVRRTPLSGGNSAHTRSDTLHPRLFIELKHGQASLINTMWKAWKKDTVIIIEDGEIVLSMIHTDNFTERKATKVKIIERKNFGAINLYKQTEKLAEKENKIPIVALHKKGMHGFLFIARATTFLNIKKEFVNDY